MTTQDRICSLASTINKELNRLVKKKLIVSGPPTERALDLASRLVSEGIVGERAYQDAYELCRLFPSSAHRWDMPRATRASARSSVLELMGILDGIKLRGIDPAHLSPRQRRGTLRVPRQAAKLAAGFLPRAGRQRYCNEYLSELDDLAQGADWPRRAQLLHAARLLIKAPALRIALRGSGTTVPERPR